MLLLLSRFPVESTLCDHGLQPTAYNTLNEGRGVGWVVSLTQWI